MNQLWYYGILQEVDGELIKVAFKHPLTTLIRHLSK